ncbi:VanZ family protein [Meridianimarinicoccus sp. RP-17]|uniref:VanZ family protein n=1 Tax=Meridianimarinicoccus zhengii TaxID=2056810 RepID=UPI0013A6E8F8|nr:VanZ family protein [Phycocomes zhengii]
MTLGWFVHFFGLAFVYAALATGLAVGGLAGFGRVRAAWHAAPAIMATAFFVFLTQHPFPDPAVMDCPLARAEPQLRPFHFLDTVAMLHDRGVGLRGWLTNKTLAAVVMNVVICAIIGAALARHVRRLRTAALFGAGLTLSVELTQLTGVWGLFPCPYRQFNVDDLILNMTGVLSGFVLVRRVLARGGVRGT